MVEMKENCMVDEDEQIDDNRICETVLGKKSYFVKNMTNRVSSSSNSKLFQQNREMTQMIKEQQKKIEEQEKRIEEQDKEIKEQGNKIYAIEKLISEQFRI